jgi:hypothetical protein
MLFTERRGYEVAVKTQRYYNTEIYCFEVSTTENFIPILQNTVLISWNKLIDFLLNLKGTVIFKSRKLEATLGSKLERSSYFIGFLTLCKSSLNEKHRCTKINFKLKTVQKKLLFTTESEDYHAWKASKISIQGDVIF